jgi:hypothetical protein
MNQQTLELHRVILFMIRVTNAAVGNLTEPAETLEKTLRVIHQVISEDLVLFDPENNDRDTNSELRLRDKDTASLVIRVLEDVAGASEN